MHESIITDSLESAVKTKNKTLLIELLNSTGFFLEVKVDQELFYTPCYIEKGIIKSKHEINLKGCDFNNAPKVTSRYVIKSGKNIISLANYLNSKLNNADLGYLTKDTDLVIK